jgi:DNA-binding MarR family transcriptional regulator
MIEIQLSRNSARLEGRPARQIRVFFAHLYRTRYNRLRSIHRGHEIVPKRPERRTTPQGSAPHVDPLHLDQQICFPLYAASRLVTRLYQPLLHPLGLTYPQYIVMMILWQDAPCSVTHVGSRALLNSNTLTPLLKRLEQSGFIHRAHSQSDERVTEIALTAEGKSLKARCTCVPGLLAESAARYPLEKALALKGMLDELITALSPSMEET